MSFCIDFNNDHVTAIIKAEKQLRSQMSGLKPEVMICSECDATWRIGKEQPPCEHLNKFREDIKTECRDW